MSRISLVSFVLLLVISSVAPVLADPLADEMASMNARWDAAPVTGWAPGGINLASAVYMGNSASKSALLMAA